MGTEGVDASQVKMGIGSKAGGCYSAGNKNILLVILGFVFVILNLAALWALHFADRPSGKGGLRAATRFTTSQLGATGGVTPSAGDAVSFSSDNVLRAGAGTTAYLDKLPLNNADVTKVEYINFAPMGTQDYYTTNVVSYVRTEGSTTNSVVTTLSYDPTTKNLTAADVDATNNVISDPVRGLATLSDTSMAVLTLYVASDWSSMKTSVIPATLDSSTGKVTLNQAKAKVVTTTSVTNFITPLTSSTFVVVYYDQSTIGQSIQVGSIATDGTISLSAAQTFGEPETPYLSTTFGAPLALAALATTSGAGFVIPYYNSVNTWVTGNTKTTDDLVGLCVTYSTYAYSTMAPTNFSTGVCDKTYLPGQYFDAVAISDDTMVIVFHDTANSNALTLVTVKVYGSSGAKRLAIRGSYVLDVSGDFDFGKQTYGFSTTPRLRVLSENRLAVSFLNPSLAGRLSVHVLGISVVGAFHEVSPTMPIAVPSFSLALSDTNKSSGTITHDVIPVGPDAFVTAFVGNREDVVNYNFAVIESLDKPVGVVQSYSSNSASVATQGRAKVDGLTAGEFHYATTSGAIVSKGTNSLESTSEYLYAANNSVVVSTDSLVGTAINDDTLFVSTAF